MPLAGIRDILAGGTTGGDRPGMGPTQLGRRRAGFEQMQQDRFAGQGIGGQQADLADELRRQMRGDGPSVAELQMQRGLESAQGQAHGLAATARGGNVGLAMRNAQMAQAGLAGQASADAAQLRAAEQIQARGELQNLLGTQAQQNLQSQGLQQGTYLGLTGQETQRQIGAGQMAEQQAGRRQSANIMTAGIASGLLGSDEGMKTDLQQVPGMVTGGHPGKNSATPLIDVLAQRYGGGVPEGPDVPPNPYLSGRGALPVPPNPYAEYRHPSADPRPLGDMPELDAGDVVTTREAERSIEADEQPSRLGSALRGYDSGERILGSGSGMEPWEQDLAASRGEAGAERQFAPPPEAANQAGQRIQTQGGRYWNPAEETGGGGDIGTYLILQELARMRRERGGGAEGGPYAAGQGLGAGVAGLFKSDEEAKTNMRASPLSEALAPIKLMSFDYKDPADEGLPPGVSKMGESEIGTTWQQVAASPSDGIRSLAVVDGQGTKRLRGPQAGVAALGVGAEQQRQIDDLQRQIDEIVRGRGRG